jgi:uracil-DNA glycosylase family 4
MASKEYLEELWSQAKKTLPGWLYAMLRNSARPVAGGRAAHRVDEPTLLEKVALQEITPTTLRKLSDEELGMVWLRLAQWFANAKRRRQSVENVVNAALWTKREMESRGREVSESELTEAVGQLEDLAKQRKKAVNGTRGVLPRHLEKIMERAPDEVLLVRDFVTVAGSAAVAEKPDDVDVVVRAPYDAKLGSYGLDGSALWVAIRRFLAPDKNGPQIQLIGAPAGSFTDYVPVFDLVARRREPQVVKIETQPPEYADRERVVKADASREASAASSELRSQAERARKEDKIAPGEFFFQPKPTRPAQPEEPQSVDALVKLYEDRADKWLPAAIQKKYDGARHQIHKVGDKVLVLSEDGDDNTSRLPGLVEEVRKLPEEKVVLDAEIEAWEDGEHLPREAVSGYLGKKDEPDDSSLVANVFDVLYWGEDLHKRPLRERLEYLAKIPGKGTMEVPDLQRRINSAPVVVVKTPAEVREQTERVRRLPGSEGIVGKQLESPYLLDVATPDLWVKFHNATVFRGIVAARTRTKGGAFTYEYGVRPGKLKPIALTPGKFVPVGTSFSSSRSYGPGDRLLVEAEQVNYELGPNGIKLTAWVPRVLGTYEGDPDSVDDVVDRASKDLVLRTKRVDEKGNVVEYLPANIKKSLRPEVPSSGPERARVAFVGASPGKMEVARREPFIGPVGETLNQLYLKPLGVSRSEVFLTNAVPRFLANSDGTVREPTVEETKEWREWVRMELDRAQPLVVVALGKTAQAALDDRADVVLPHPSAVRRFGDSGEVGRKLKRVREMLAEIEKVAKQKGPEEEETRTERAVANWNSTWQDMLPASGEGRFVYQHHWRGLPEEETSADDADLMKTDHSVHGDLRLEGKDGLWGFTIFLGLTKDNRGPNLDKLIDWKPGDNIEAGPKLLQPKDWLDVGVGKPYVSPPGGVGATTKMFSKFFERDRGTYKLGVARLHMVEIFLDGKDLSGRYLLMFAPVAGRRRWLIDKPDDQKPMAETRDLTDVLGELRRKGQRFLVWAKPGERPKFFDVKTGREVEKKNASVEIVKADPIKRIVYGVVLDPYGNRGAPETDAHNDWTPPSVVEKTAHEYLKTSRVVGLQHKQKANAAVVESWVEPYPTRGDYLRAMREQDHAIFRRPFGSDVLHSGSWVMGIELGPKEWEDYQDGVFNAFSPGGQGIKRPLSPRSMPKVRIIELKENPSG